MEKVDDTDFEYIYQSGTTTNPAYDANISSYIKDDKITHLRDVPDLTDVPVLRDGSDLSDGPGFI